MLKIKTLLLISLFCFAPAKVVASDFNEDYGVIKDKIERYASDKGLTRDDLEKNLRALENYNNKRSNALESMLRVLESSDPERILDTWNSKCEEGLYAVEELSRQVPFDSLGSDWREFGENETKFFRWLKENPVLAKTRVTTIEINRKTIEATNKLDEDWKNIERQDYAEDEMARNTFQSEYKPAIDDLVKTVRVLAAEGGLKVPGNPLLQESIKYSAKALTYYKVLWEIRSRETLIWRTFEAEREVASQIHSQIDFSIVERAINQANSDSRNDPTGRKDYESFQSRAFRALQEAGRDPYDKFIDANRGKFIESLDSRWKDILTDPKDVEEQMNFFEVNQTTLNGLLEKWEEYVNLMTEGPEKRAKREILNKLRLDGREMTQDYQRGMALYKSESDKLK